jgi:hypothetical protein
MMQTPDTAALTVADRHHIALHLAHRWFAFLEAPGGDLDAHLSMFHPEVRLSGHRGTHLFARDRRSLVTWFASIPDAISSHHIVHSSYAHVDRDNGVLNMVVAYQTPGDKGVHGSIISYETRVGFTPDKAWFVSLDKTPTLANTRPRYETSWATNRVLARVHAGLGGITGPDCPIRAALGDDVIQVFAQATAAEGSAAYEAIVTGITAADVIRVVRLTLADNGKSTLPMIERVTPLAA